MSHIRRHGISLLEMIVVVALIAILSGGAGVYYTGVIEETRRDRARTDLRQLAKMLVKFESERGLPITTYGDISEVSSTGSVMENNLNKLTEYQIVTQLPTDPWGAAYRIDIPAGILFSCGPDSLSTSPDDVFVVFRPRFEPKSARLTTNQVHDQIQLEFSRPVDRSVLTTEFFSINGSGITTWTTAVVDMWNSNNVLLELDGLLPDTCDRLIVAREAYVDHLGALTCLRAMDSATLVSDCVIDIER